MRNKVGGRLVALLLALTLLIRLSCPAEAVETDWEVARPSTSGSLRVEGTTLVGENGKHEVLQGVSTHGLTWYPEYISEELFGQISREWDCNLVRLAMYSELYCGGEQAQNLALLEKGIEAAVAADMYVLVDWHILNDSNPMENAVEAQEFFEYISAKYGDLPNVVYEICNEPNGDTDWMDVSAYAHQIIPAIRQNDPDSVIIVGTPNYDRELLAPLLSPLPFENVMYTCHFYTATHGPALMAELTAALDNGIPVFITECGLSEASGDGELDLENAISWFRFLREHQLSFAVWSLSNKPETSALVKETVTDPRHLEDDDLTPPGHWLRALLLGQDPAEIHVEVPEGGRSFWDSLRALLATAGSGGLLAIGTWPLLALIALGILLVSVLASLLLREKGRRHRKPRTYDELLQRTGEEGAARSARHYLLRRVLILVSVFFALLYLGWRIRFSLPTQFGWLAVAANLVLLLVEVLGFAETLIHYRSVLGMRNHPLPRIAPEDYPEVDIFIATYNEPVDLLRRTVRGCTYLKYPDKSKVHVWICDDNRRPAMRALAQEMGVGYFDRPDNQGAKAGNLNHAMGLTHAPYVVTFDADMIPRSDFLLKTIPYFVDAERRSRTLPEEDRVHLGLLQTPQAFYDPDVFQHALYAERRAPNEQDFFYRTIEVAKTATNSVIYGGSNTILSRAALEAAGGFFTGSITEDFATGLLIESAGYLSLALPEPLASGRTPHTFKEHVQQRTRWGRGVIVTGKKLKLFRRKGLTLAQKLSYWSSVSYWYSPLKNWIYMLSPLLFAVFALPVFRCTWLELLIYWLPMFLLQDLSLRLVSHNAVSTKWSGIYETCVMPHLLVPILKESLGISLSAFKVTDKSAQTAGRRRRDWRSMIPFLVLIALSVAGIVRTVLLLNGIQSLGLLIILFWLVRNLYYLLMAVFLVDGRDSDGEPVHVFDSEPVVLQRGEETLEGITTQLTEHSFHAFLDRGETVRIGDAVTAEIDTGAYRARVSGVVIGVQEVRSTAQCLCTVEILDFGDAEGEYQQILYDRVPTLPQNLRRDFGTLPHLWRNIARRMARTGR